MTNLLIPIAETLIAQIETGEPYDVDEFLWVQRALSDHITKHGGTREVELAYDLADARLQSFRRSEAHDAYIKAGCTHEAWVEYCKATGIEISA